MKGEHLYQMGKTYRYNKLDGNWENRNKANNQKARKNKAEKKTKANEENNDQSGLYNMQRRKQTGLRSR